MAQILKNDFLTVTISEHGAEVQSIINNHTNQEYTWQADPQVWKRHAPVLFPIVGALKDDTYTYQGQSYHMTQHGFARDRDFTVVESSANRVVFELKDDAQTRQQYPFAFNLRLIFTLDNNALNVNYVVTNPSADADLIFGIGGHPGFVVPLSADTKFEDYYLEFKPRKSRVQIPLIAGQGIDYANRTLAATDVNQALTHDLFRNDAVIYALKGQTIFSIRSEKTRHGVEVTIPDAPFLGVWSPYPTTGNFVCIEPWWGIADPVDADGELTHKLGMNTLQPGAVFDHSYSIAIF
ncbi:aldose 1-epimerase family protein [Lacticaseibacillus jixiensis]|uniref:aldose 1-epimerase family protein n=1 Tax=Lacticaseibacillus jixiensis TaxID=3231926 RepID=UPI0036F38604